MSKFKLYLDTCCFNRPYDDKSSLNIYLEAEAKLFVQKEILNGSFDLIWSFILDYEISVNPYHERQEIISRWKSVAVKDIDYSEKIVVLSRQIALKGVKNKDSLHIACAIDGGCDYFLTTDKRLLNKQFHEIIIFNPLDFIRKLGV